MKKVISIFLVLIMITSFTAAVPKNETGFPDVPKGHFFEEYINKLKELNITNGQSDGTFGFNKEISRVEFLVFLVRLQNKQLAAASNIEVFKDVKATDWYYPYVDMGLKSKIIIASEYQNGSFMPAKPITREEMAVMIVRAMEYDYLASAINNQPSQFQDVKQRTGYIELAKDLGIINGRAKGQFDPAANATKQEAAAMLIRMYNINNNQLDTLNTFYAIKSYNQIDKINVFDTISYGWTRLDFNEAAQQIELTSTLKNGGHPFYVPEDFQLAVKDVNPETTSKYLMVFGSNEDLVTINGKEEKLVSLLLNNTAAVDKLVSDLSGLVCNLSDGSNSVQFDGVVIDFEGLRDNGLDKGSFVGFLTKLNTQLDANGKKLMVCINPPREAGQMYYNGYDFAAIGKLADYVVLMAHDYDSKYISNQEMQYFKGETPLAPIKDIYYAIKYVLMDGAGVPKDKLLLQLSFSAAQWQFINDSPLNNSPYNPDYIKINNRMRDTNTAIKNFNYSELYQSPYLTYEADGVRNIIWYEDERSIAAKARLAKLFGLEGLSFWRMGIIPDFSAPEDVANKLNVMDLIERINN